MGRIIKFPRQQTHVRISPQASRCAATSTRRSAVISDLPTSAANLTTSRQCSDGMPRGRLRQPLTVPGDCSSRRASAPTPSAPMTESHVHKSAIDTDIVCDLRTSQASAERELTFRKEWGSIFPMDDNDQDIARRLIALRKRLGFEKQSDFAKEIGLEKSSYNPFETRRTPSHAKRRATHPAAIWNLRGLALIRRSRATLPEHCYRARAKSRRNRSPRPSQRNDGGQVSPRTKNSQIENL